MMHGEAQGGWSTDRVLPPEGMTQISQRGRTATESASEEARNPGEETRKPLGFLLASWIPQRFFSR